MTDDMIKTEKTLSTLTEYIAARLVSAMPNHNDWRALDCATMMVEIKIPHEAQRTLEDIHLTQIPDVNGQFLTKEEFYSTVLSEFCFLGMSLSHAMYIIRKAGGNVEVDRVMKALYDEVNKRIAELRALEVTNETQIH